MGDPEIIQDIKKRFPDLAPLEVLESYQDEITIKVKPETFFGVCLALHKILLSPVMALFALDERKNTGKFVINAVFVNLKQGQWVTVTIDVDKDNPHFNSLSKDIHSASLFEREIYEMFGVKPEGNPDLRRLKLHDEVWPEGNYPLRKDFKEPKKSDLTDYKFNRVDGEGIFEIPVGPVHAGIIGPGHFRFSVAGEPIISLETRLGFTHRGVEKLFENKSVSDGIKLSESIAGDSAISYSLAFSMAAEKIFGVSVPQEAVYARGIYLELERMYNHITDIGGIALDVGFSFPSEYAAIIKENILQLNKALTNSRFLKNSNTIGGINTNFDSAKIKLLLRSLESIKHDFWELVKVLDSSVSFMDRVDTTGILRKKTAEDLGVVGLAGRASGISIDLRKQFSPIYKEAKFKISTYGSGDVLARLRVRCLEFEESGRLIEEFAKKISHDKKAKTDFQIKEGCALGYAEGWRGPVLFWLKIDSKGLIERCKIVDPSFSSWQALTYAVLGNIIPDFPLCNKSFDLSYPGNDL